MDPKGVDFSKLDSTADVLNIYIDKGETDVYSPDLCFQSKDYRLTDQYDYKKLTSQLAPLSVEAQRMQAEARAATPAQQSSADFQNSMQAS